MAPKPLTVLTALTAGATASWLAMPLVLAQAVPGAEETTQPAPTPTPTPVLRPSVRIAEPITRPEAQAPVQPLAPPPPLTGEAPPSTLRPGAAERRPEPARRLDASLDALVREGVVTPAERVRVRGSLL